MIQVRIQDVRPVRGMMLVEVDKRGLDEYATPSGLIVHYIHKLGQYRQEVDWEIGSVVAVGEGDWEPVKPGDRVIVRAISGGKAGSDISAEFGRPRGELIVVKRDEVIAKLEE